MEWQHWRGGKLISPQCGLQLQCLELFPACSPHLPWLPKKGGEGGNPWRGVGKLQSMHTCTHTHISARALGPRLGVESVRERWWRVILAPAELCWCKGSSGEGGRVGGTGQLGLHPQLYYKPSIITFRATSYKHHRSGAEPG